MTEPKRAAGWLDYLSLVMVLLIAVATGAAVVGAGLTLVHGDPGEAWLIAGAGAVASTGLFVVAVLIQAVRGDVGAAPPVAPGEGVGGRTED